MQKKRIRWSLSMMTVLAVLGWISPAQTPRGWKSHDMQRPHPPRVEPAKVSLPVGPPGDAVVLFDGSDLDSWQAADGGPALWKVENGYMEVVVEGGSIQTRQGFGDVQLHVEWASPLSAAGEGQDRGNSGVYLMGLYEVQVLDSWENPTYADGQAGAVYGQYPPLANASRPPGQWQSFDIVFRRPRFDSSGGLIQPARLTVFHNGILVQDGVVPVGPTSWLQPGLYRSHPDRLPLQLQHHDHPVRFRNIWLRELPEWAPPGPPPESSPQVRLSEEVLERYVGSYRFENEGVATVQRRGSQLFLRLYRPRDLELVPRSEGEFELRWTAAKLVFDLDTKGNPTGLVFHIGRQKRPARRIE